MATSNRRLLVVVVAVTVVGFLAPASRPGEEDENKDVAEARKVLLKMARVGDDGRFEGDSGVMKKGADELVARKIPLRLAMYVFKLRTAGGVGVGKEGTVSPDGVEAKLINLSKRELTAAAAKKEGPALEQAANLALAMTHVLEAYTPKNRADGRDARDWMDYTREMRQAAEEFAAAARKVDPKAIKATAGNLSYACNNCHWVGRD